MNRMGNTAPQGCTIVDESNVTPSTTCTMTPNSDARKGARKKYRCSHRGVRERRKQSFTSAMAAFRTPEGTSTHSILPKPAVVSRDTGGGARKWRLALRASTMRRWLAPPSFFTTNTPIRSPDSGLGIASQIESKRLAKRLYSFLL